MNLPIPTTDTPVPFTPLALLEQHETALKLSAGEFSDTPRPGPVIVFMVKPATELDYERLVFELYRHNISPPTQEHFKSTLIDEIFEIFGDEKGEEYADMLDGFWTAEDVYQSQMEEWLAQDRQRRFDEQNGAAPRPPAPLPTRTIGTRDRHKALLFAADMNTRSDRLRNLFIEMQTFEPKQRSGIARLCVTGWDNASTPFALENGIIPASTWDALRREIGKAAMDELIDFAAGMGSLTADDVGNSESQLETELTTDSSLAPSAEPDSSAGASISGEQISHSTSSSEPAPPCASDPGTDRPSNSTSPSTGASESIDDTRPEATSEPLAG